MGRMAATCCCIETDPNNGPCVQWAEFCYNFPVTISIVFQGSYIFEQLDACSYPTEVVTDRLTVTYSGSLTGTATSASQFQIPTTNPVYLCGTATANAVGESWVNGYNGTTCGEWKPCGRWEQTFGTCTNVDSANGFCYGGFSCIGPNPTGNRWNFGATFRGTGVYSFVTYPECCATGNCPPYSVTAPVEISVGGGFLAGCIPANCPPETTAFCNCPDENCPSVGLVGSYPFHNAYRLQNQSYFDSTLYQKHTFTGTVICVIS